MEADINEPKSRAFNIYLRFFQLGLSLLIGIFIAKIDPSMCEHSFYNVGTIVAIALTLLNLLAIVYLRCKSNFPKVEFFITLALNFILSAVVMIIAFTGIGDPNGCAANIVIFRLTVFYVIVFGLIVLAILFLSFYWIQRYTNSPGNIVWFGLFVTFQWTDTFVSKMIAIGLLCLLVSILTLIANVIAGFKGITTKVKKVIVALWVFGLLFMVLCEIIGVAAYFAESAANAYNDLVAKTVVKIFLALNILEIAFWLFGLLTLNYQNGDKIRDALLSFGKDDEEGNQNEEHEEERQQGYGTIK